MTMIERVARAIAWQTLTDHGREACQWPADFSEGEADRFRLQARAAIEAMREPTEAMKLAGEMARAKSDLAEDAYTAMIDEALR